MQLFDVKLHSAAKTSDKIRVRGHLAEHLHCNEVSPGIPRAICAFYDDTHVVVVV